MVRRGRTSFDAVFIASQLLCFPFFKHYCPGKRELKFEKDIHRHLKSLGRRISHICAIYGHPEATFWNVKYFQRLYRHHAKHPNYHLYRKELIEILKSMGGAYPDTRVYSHMVALELTPGGDLEKARHYSLLGLERATRPRGYEISLVYAGKLLQDHQEAMKALQLAIQLLSHPIRVPKDGDPFPFATRLRGIYKYQTLEFVADVLYERAQGMSNAMDARELLKTRDEVLRYRRSLKPHLTAMGVKPGDEEFRLYIPGTIDEMMFQLLDPEAVLEEEELMPKPRATIDGGSQRLQILSLTESMDTVAELQGK